MRKSVIVLAFACLPALLLAQSGNQPDPGAPHQDANNATLEQMRQTMSAQQEEIEKLESALQELRAAIPQPANARPTVTPAAFHPDASPTAAATEVEPNSSSDQRELTQETAPESPFQFRIGSAYITPVGFMDFTSEFRSKDNGSGIGTNFGSIPYGNGTFQSNLSEFRFSMQNSRRIPRGRRCERRSCARLHGVRLPRQ